MCPIIYNTVSHLRVTRINSGKAQNEKKAERLNNGCVNKQQMPLQNTLSPLTPEL